MHFYSYHHNIMQFYMQSLSLCNNLNIYTHSTTDHVYAVPDDIELKQKVNTTRSAPLNNERSHRQEYKEEVEIRYEKPVLTSNLKTTVKNTNTKKPLVPPTYGTGTSHKTRSNQTDDERIYRPMVPSKTYKGTQDILAYQDLAFETRETEGGVQVNNSEGQYEVVARKEEINAYEPLSFGVSGCEEGVYQPLTFQGVESSIYQLPQTTPT